MFGLTRTRTRGMPFLGFTISGTIIFPRDHHRPCELSRDGWKAFGVVWKKDNTYLYLYHFMVGTSFAATSPWASFPASSWPTNSHQLEPYSPSQEPHGSRCSGYDVVLPPSFLEPDSWRWMLSEWNKVGPGLHFFATVMGLSGTRIFRR